MKKDLKQLIYLVVSCKLAFLLAYRRLTSMFARTKLGFFWISISSLITSSLIFAVYSIVFKIENSVDYFSYLVLGVAIWFAITFPLNNFANTFKTHKGKILNTSLKGSFFVMEEMAYSLFNAVLITASSLLILVFIRPYYLINFLKASFYIIPILLLFLFSIGTFLAYLSARFKDFIQIIPLIIQITFVTSPIMYPKKGLGPLAEYLLINPIYLVFDVIRTSIISPGEFPSSMQFIPVIFITLFLMSILALRIMRKFDQKVFYWL